MCVTVICSAEKERVRRPWAEEGEECVTDLRLAWLPPPSSTDDGADDNFNS